MGLSDGRLEGCLELAGGKIEVLRDWLPSFFLPYSEIEAVSEVVHLSFLIP